MIRIKDGIYFQDISEVPGTNCYLDDGAADFIRKEISDLPVTGVRFLGSGNYHYLSYLWMEKIREDFALLLLDNHPDNMPPAFPGLLSCGGWVERALLDFSNLKAVYMCGVSKEHLEEVGRLPDEVSVISTGDILAIPKGLPLYISLDKDVLSKDFAATDWDQGDMSLNSLLDIFNSLKAHNILAIDICGDKKAPTPEELELNNRVNREILLQIPL